MRSHWEDAGSVLSVTPLLLNETLLARIHRRVHHMRARKSLAPLIAGPARSAVQCATLVAGPRSFERNMQLVAQRYDVGLGHRQKRREDFDARETLDREIHHRRECPHKLRP